MLKRRPPSISLDRPWLTVCFVVLAVGIAYYKTLSVPFLFDDIESIARNRTIGNAWSALLPPVDSGITVSGRPILNASFALSGFLGKDTLAGHHLFNILIHCLNTLLFCGLIRMTLSLSPEGRQWKYPGPVALSVALLWSLHPLQTESVTYLVQRAESQVAFFYLLTIWLFVRAARTSGSWAPVLLGASIITCCLGMGTKEVMVSAPVIVLFYDRAFFCGDVLTALRLRKSYYFGLSLTWAFLGFSIAQSGFRGNTTGFNTGATWASYIYTQAFAITHYLQLVVWPDPLVFDYGRDLIDSFRDIWWRATLVLIGTSIVLKRWWQNRPSGFLGVFFLAILAPTALVPIATQPIAEHRVYLALAALFAAVALFLARALGEKIAISFCFGLSAVLLLATLTRNNDYSSAETIWTDTLNKRPQNDRAWYSLGHVYLDKRQTEKAKRYFLKAIQLRNDPTNIMGYAHALTQSGETDEAIPLYRTTLAAVPRTYNDVYESMANLGLLLGKKGLHDEAIRWLTEAISVDPQKTGAYYNLGALYFKLGRFEESSAALRDALADPYQGDDACSLLVRALLSLGRKDEALALAEKQKIQHPNSLLLRLAYAQSLASTGKAAAAILEYRAILALDPAFPSARTQLGILFFATRRLDAARRELELAIAQNPDDASAQSTLAEVLLKSGQPDDAVPHFEAALRLAPADYKSRYMLANTLLQLGRFDDAIGHYQNLIGDRAAPLAEIHNELAIAYAQKKDFAEARVHFTECLRLDPTHTGAAENLRRLP